MRVVIIADMHRHYAHRAKNGFDIEVVTKSGHIMWFNVREHGARLQLDGDKIADVDFE